MVSPSISRSNTEDIARSGSCLVLLLFLLCPSSDRSKSRWWRTRVPVVREAGRDGELGGDERGVGRLRFLPWALLLHQPRHRRGRRRGWGGIQGPPPHVPVTFDSLYSDHSKPSPVWSPQSDHWFSMLSSSDRSLSLVCRYDLFFLFLACIFLYVMMNVPCFWGLQLCACLGMMYLNSD